MPMYEYECRKCGNHFDEYKSISEYEKSSKSEPCQCGSDDTRRVITPSAVIQDIEPYRSTITGERIRGRSHHRQHLAQHGYEEIGTDNIEEAKKTFHRPPEEKPKDLTEDVVRAYEKAAGHG